MVCVVCTLDGLTVGVCAVFVFFFQAEDGIRDLVRSRGLGDVYKRQRYGVYPYILTDIGLYLYDGKEIVEIYKPIKPNEHFLDGLLKQSRLFILTSAYRLVALSLDGKIVNEASSNQIGGFKLLSTDNAVYAVGRNKVAGLSLSPKPSEGSYFDLKDYGEVIDAQIRNAEMWVLTSENGQFGLRKIGLIP